MAKVRIDQLAPPLQRSRHSGIVANRTVKDPEHAQCETARVLITDAGLKAEGWDGSEIHLAMTGLIQKGALREEVPAEVAFTFELPTAESNCAEIDVLQVVCHYRGVNIPRLPAVKIVCRQLETLPLNPNFQIDRLHFLR